MLFRSSKSVPHKNIRKLGGIPLLGWVIRALNNSKLVDKIILSTDSEKYYEIAKSFNDDIIFHKRTPELAEDVQTELVLIDVVKKLNKLFDKDTIIVLVQPTTPFITGKSIDDCIRKVMHDPKISTCVSVKEAEYPEWMIRAKNKKPDVGFCKNLSGKFGIRQNLETRFIPNGGIYVVRRSFLMKNKKLVNNHNTMIYVMSKLRSIDIDGEADFIMCEALVKSKIINKEKQ